MLPLASIFGLKLYVRKKLSLDGTETLTPTRNTMWRHRMDGDRKYILRMRRAVDAKM
jgi:hypothetical protein